MLMLKRSCAIVFFLLFGGGLAPAQTSPWTTAASNAEKANAALVRCQRVMNAWYPYAGRGNLLLPRTPSQREWIINDSASDMWAHFVNAAFVLGDPGLEAKVRGTLLDEMRLSTRVGRLPDNLNVDTRQFEGDSPDVKHMLFMTAEEVKDGLVPIVDLTGQKLYTERGRALLSDIMKYATTSTRYGKIPDGSAETNGDMLQSLCRLYGATGDPNLKAWAERIGDAWIYQVLPRSNGLPCHSFDFSRNRVTNNRIQLLDHGNEIVVGLVELLFLEYVHDANRYSDYKPAMVGMIDKLIDHARDKNGIWYSAIQPTDYKVVDYRLMDVWGYCTSAVYAMYMMTGYSEYREMVEQAMRSVATKPQYLNWGWSQDSWADSIEGGILLYNRIRMPEMAAWLEKITPTFLAMQKSNGMVQDTYLDGNYVRTALMWAQMKTAGTRLAGWRADVKFGASVEGSRLYVQVSAGGAWSGLLCFDAPRARLHEGLKYDYPRLNQYPQWYTVEPACLYDVTVDGAAKGPMLGQELIEGLALRVKDKSTPARVVVTPRSGAWFQK